MMYFYSSLLITSLLLQLCKWQNPGFSVCTWIRCMSNPHRLPKNEEPYSKQLRTEIQVGFLVLGNSGTCSDVPQNERKNMSNHPSAFKKTQTWTVKWISFPRNGTRNWHSYLKDISFDCMFSSIGAQFISLIRLTSRHQPADLKKKSNMLHGILQKIWLKKNGRGKPFTPVANHFLSLLDFEVRYPPALLDKKSLSW